MSGLARRGEPRRASSENGWGVETCSRSPADVAPDARLRGAAPTRCGGLARRHRARRLQAVRRRGGGRRTSALLRDDEARARRRKRSSGSRRPRRWCWTWATGSWSGRPAGGRPWPAAPCSTSRLRRGPGPTPSSGSPRAPTHPATTLPELLVEERGAIRAADVFALTRLHDGSGGVTVAEWRVADALRTAVQASVAGALAAYHAEHPLEVGAALTLARSAVTGVLRAARAPTDPALADALLTDLSDVASSPATRRRPPDVAPGRPPGAFGGRRTAAPGDRRRTEATPPTVRELVAAGIGRDVIDAAAREGLVVRVSSDLVMTPTFVARAEATVPGAVLRASR